MTTMLLKNLINNLDPKIAYERVKGISSDSRKVKKGDLFISIKGNKLDGNSFIKDAISRGAKAVVYSETIKKKYPNIILIKVTDSRSELAEISSKFYQKKPKNIVAVTGTNGKTSVSDFFYQILKLFKKPVGMIGTLGFKKNNNFRERELTTSDTIGLHRDLNELKNSKIENVILEASSHGLKQKRLDFLNIKTGIFTNLSHDHLDYHKDMKDYFSAKLILFKKILKKRSTIITDSEIKQYSTFKNLTKARKLNLLSIGNSGNTFEILSHNFFKGYQLIKIKYKNKVYNLRIYLIGSVQIKNLLMAILASEKCGIKIQSIFKKIHKIKSVNGRLEEIKELPNRSKIFLDYAHTPEALKTAINALKEHYKKKITVVFGCGGERDKSKRKLMGKIANQLCNKVIITDDNPRNESPKIIREQILSVIKKNKFKEIPGRKKAIIYALKNSDPYEIILVAGRGHETYQDFGKRKVSLSDKKIIQNFNSKKINTKINHFKNNSTLIKKILKNKKNIYFEGVSINSKSIKKNNLFVAIKGKKKDGHDFLKEAIKKGANYSIVSKKIKKSYKPLKVKNTLNFLQDFSQKKREDSSAKFIAVTGSAGKTSLKTMLGGLLNKYSKTYFSPLSYNNHYGVPLSLSNISPDHTFGVFEVGMSKFNEIFRLSSLVKPDIGIITNISEAHLENFRNISDIAKAKGEIISNIQKGGTIILNRDDSFFNYFKQEAIKNKIQIKSFGYSKKADIRFLKSKKIKNNFYIELSINKAKILLPVGNINKSNVMNILSCFSVLDCLGLNLENIKNYFKKNKPLKGRGSIKKIKKFGRKFFLIDESYNANPISIKSAIENFSNISKNGKKKYFFFGDMMELGKKSHIYHKKVTKFINNSDIDKTFVYGKRSSAAFKFIKKNKRGEILDNIHRFNLKISKIIKNGDLLMIKGSHATKLHKISENYLRGNNHAL